MTGEKVLGVGDASGMFPIDPKTKQYDAVMMDKFERRRRPPLCMASGRYFTGASVLPEKVQEVLSGRRCKTLGSKR